jgi:large subunit ribosomal protein L13
MPEDAPTPPASAPDEPKPSKPASTEAPKPRRPRASPAPKAPRAERPAATPAAAEGDAPKSTSPSAPPRPAPASAAPAPAKTAAVPTGTVVDATGLVLGRAASLIAKRLLQGETIVVDNSERSVVTGDRAMVLETYRAHRARGSKRTGPHFPRYPDRIFRRTVRGMLPHLKTRGKEALARLQVHIGVPPELQGAKASGLESAEVRPALRRPITLAEISRLLGARV